MVEIYSLATSLVNLCSQNFAAPTRRSPRLKSGGIRARVQCVLLDGIYVGMMTAEMEHQQDVGIFDDTSLGPDQPAQSHRCEELLHVVLSSVAGRWSLSSELFFP